VPLERGVAMVDYCNAVTASILASLRAGALEVRGQSVHRCG